MSSSSKVVFLFYPGRIMRINRKADSSKEFFYSYHAISKLLNTEVMEIDNCDNFIQKVLKIYDKVIFKLIKLQSNSEKYCKLSYLILFFSNRKLIFTNFALAISAFPLLILTRTFKKKNTFVINSGLFAFKEVGSIRSGIRNLYLKLFFIYVEKIIFTSKSEFNFANDIFPNSKNRFELIEFCPDYDFWAKNNNKIFETKSGILFIGNDSSRDFLILKQIAEKLPEIKFTFITKEKSLQNINLKNVNVISGKWHSEDLSDLQIKEHYLNSKLTILPIKDTLVSSGQSVTMQSMSCGTPVMISNTKGFWNQETFIHCKNILFVKDNTVEDWVNSINEFYYKDKILENISSNAKRLLSENYNLEKFDKSFLKLIL